MRGLYAIVDTKFLASRGTDPVQYARAVLEAKPAALQLRAKDVGAREILTLLRVLGPLCRTKGVPLVANDRADLAALAGCEWRTSVRGSADRARASHRSAARHRRVDTIPRSRARGGSSLYVAYGPVFETASKNPDPVVGVEGLRQAHRLAAAIHAPLVAIGGITLARAAGALRGRVRRDRISIARRQPA